MGDDEKERPRRPAVAYLEMVRLLPAEYLTSPPPSCDVVDIVATGPDGVRTQWRFNFDLWHELSARIPMTVAVSFV